MSTYIYYRVFNLTVFIILLSAFNVSGNTSTVTTDHVTSHTSQQTTLPGVAERATHGSNVSDLPTGHSIETTNVYDNITDMVTNNNTASNESTTTRPRRTISKTYREYPEYKYYKAISKNYIYFVSFPGMVGNSLTAVVALRMKPYTSTTVCIFTLAVTDLAMNIARAVYRLATIETYYYCRSVDFVLALIGMFSNLTLVCWTLERLVAVVFPMKLQIWCSIRNTKIALFCAFLISLGIASAFLFEVSTTDIQIGNIKLTMCVFSDMLVDVYFNVENTFYIWAPMVIIFFSNAVILHRMALRKKSHASMTTNSETQDKRNAEQRHMTIVLVTVSFLFFLFHVPHTIKLIYDSYNLDDLPYGDQAFFAKYLLWGVLTAIWLQLQNSVNFIAYCLSGPRFRQEFVNLLCCGRKRQAKPKPSRPESSTGITSVSKTV